MKTLSRNLLAFMCGCALLNTGMICGSLYSKRNQQNGRPWGPHGRPTLGEFLFTIDM